MTKAEETRLRNLTEKAGVEKLREGEMQWLKKLAARQRHTRAILSKQVLKPLIKVKEVQGLQLLQIRMRGQVYDGALQMAVFQRQLGCGFHTG